MLLIFFFLFIVEIFTGFLLRNSKYIPKSLICIFREYYMLHDRLVIQAVPDLSNYDKDLFYILQSGQFIFQNREFKNTFLVDSIGMRDDEKSLEFPEVIACGDSYTMGWGVEQKQSFPEIIENQLKTKVLNAGISSYGTVRELQSLKRIKTDSLKYLIIQYSDNDYEENREFIQNHFHLKISSEETYKETCRGHIKHHKYFLFKHVIFLPKIIAKWIMGKPVGTFDAEIPDENLNEQKAFLEVVNYTDFLPENITIIVFNMDYRKSKADFIPMLKKEIENYPELKKKMLMIDFSKSLTNEYFYILDDHLTAEGHRLVAGRILDQIKLN